MAEVGAVTMHLSDVKMVGKKKKYLPQCKYTVVSPPDSLGSRDINVITLLEPAHRQQGWKVITGVTVDYEHEMALILLPSPKSITD